MKSVRRKIGNRRSVHLRKKALRRQTKKQMKRQTKRTRRRRKIRSSRRKQRGGGLGFKEVTVELNDVGDVTTFENVLKGSGFGKKNRNIAVLKIDNIDTTKKQQLSEYINKYWDSKWHSKEKTEFETEITLVDEATNPIIILWFDPTEPTAPKNYDLLGGGVLSSENPFSLPLKKNGKIKLEFLKRNSIELSSKELYDHFAREAMIPSSPNISTMATAMSAIPMAHKHVAATLTPKTAANELNNISAIEQENQKKLEQKLEQIMSFCLEWFEEDENRYDEEGLWRTAPQQNYIDAIYTKARKYLDKNVELNHNLDVLDLLTNNNEGPTLTQHLKPVLTTNVGSHLLLSLYKKLSGYAKENNIGHFPIENKDASELQNNDKTITTILQSLSKPRKNIIKKTIVHLKKIIDNKKNRMDASALAVAMTLGVFGIANAKVLVETLYNYDESVMPDQTTNPTRNNYGNQSTYTTIDWSGVSPGGMPNKPSSDNMVIYSDVTVPEAGTDEHVQNN